MSDHPPLDLTKLRVIEITQAHDGSVTHQQMQIRDVRPGLGGYYTTFEMWHVPDRCRRPRWETCSIGRLSLDEVRSWPEQTCALLYLYEMPEVEAVTKWKGERLRFLRNQLDEINQRIRNLEKS